MVDYTCFHKMLGELVPSAVVFAANADQKDPSYINDELSRYTSFSRFITKSNSNYKEKLTESNNLVNDIGSKEWENCKITCQDIYKLINYEQNGKGPCIRYKRIFIVIYIACFWDSFVPKIPQLIYFYQKHKLGTATKVLSKYGIVFSYSSIATPRKPIVYPIPKIRQVFHLLDADQQGTYQQGADQQGTFQLDADQQSTYQSDLDQEPQIVLFPESSDPEHMEIFSPSINCGDDDPMFGFQNENDNPMDSYHTPDIEDL